MWNYRIIKKGDSYGLYEVIYNDDGEICAHSESPELEDCSIQELLSTLRLMLDDAQKSSYNILDYDKIKFSEFCKDMDKSEEITFKELNDILKELD